MGCEQPRIAFITLAKPKKVFLALVFSRPIIRQKMHINAFVGSFVKQLRKYLHHLRPPQKPHVAEMGGGKRLLGMCKMNSSIPSLFRTCMPSSIDSHIFM